MLEEMEGHDQIVGAFEEIGCQDGITFISKSNYDTTVESTKVKPWVRYKNRVPLL